MRRKIIALFLLLGLLLSGCEYGIVFESNPTETEAPETETGIYLEVREDIFTVHFIDVGQADCTLLESDGEFMLIDGGNKDDSQLVVAYLKSQGVEELEAVVCTHAHEDHVGGLPAALAVFPTRAVYAPTKTYDSRVFDSFLRYTDQQGLEVTIPVPGDSWELGGAEVTVLGPVKSYAEPNNTSIVLLVEFGETRFLFTGDMELEAETDMLDHWEDRMEWDVDVLKVGHHGSDTSSGYRFIYMTQPEYGVVPVGRDNTYGHPNSYIMERYAAAGTVIFRTDRLGDVIARSNGKTVTFLWENQKAEPENALPAGSISYIGNTSSLVFHSDRCLFLPGEKKRVFFDSFLDALEAGYSPCNNCLR